MCNDGFDRVLQLFAPMLRAISIVILIAGETALGRSWPLQSLVLAVQMAAHLFTCFRTLFCFSGGGGADIQSGTLTHPGELPGPPGVRPSAPPPARSDPARPSPHAPNPANRVDLPRNGTLMY